MKIQLAIVTLTVLCLTGIQTLSAKDLHINPPLPIEENSKIKSLSIAVDGLGNIYTAGLFSGIVDFDPGIGMSHLISTESINVFIQKLDANGDFVWAKQMGDILYNEGISMTVDSVGNLYITGIFSGIVDFNMGTGINHLTSVGENSFFIQKSDMNGELVWVKKI